MKTMPISLVIFMLVVMAIPVSASVSRAHELAGWIEGEARFFPRGPMDPGQREQNGSLALQLEYYHAWGNGLDFIFTPFARLDSADSERTHYDLRECNLHFPGGLAEIRAGIGKVFWGVTEFIHLIDIINQTDLVESMDQEEKLGQPMLHLSRPSDYGTLDLFILPWFRERTFPGRKGRLRSIPPVDTDHPVYESGAEQSHSDVALRWSRTIGSADLGLAHFRGTGREPRLEPGLAVSGEPALIPHYDQISQTSMDLQMAVANWLWKLESYHRSSSTSDHFAWTGGFEYTFFAVAGSGTDAGLLAEYVHDSRPEENGPPYDNDLMFGLRLNLNDLAGTEALFGVLLDLEGAGRILSMEAGRRLGESVRIGLEGVIFSGIGPQDPLYSLRQDDHLLFTLTCYF